MLVRTSAHHPMSLSLSTRQHAHHDMMPAPAGDTKQSLLESTTEITQNKHVKVLHYFVDDIK